MKIVERHTVDLVRQQLLRDAAPGLLGKIVDGIERDPFRLGALLSHGLDEAGRDLVLDGVTAQVRTDLKLACAGGIGLFEAVSRPNEKHELRLPDRVVPFRGFPSNNLAGARAWLTSLQLATVVRDAAAQQTLCGIPAQLLRPKGITSEEYTYEWIEALRTFHMGSERFAQHLIRALEKTDPRVLRHSPADWVLNLDVPQMDLLSKLASDDQPGFDAALVKSLEHHKKYWSKQARKDDTDGFLALGPLAFACMAYDQGWPLNVESPYIPRALVERA